MMLKKSSCSVFNKILYILGAIWILLCLNWIIRIFFPSPVHYEFLYPADQIASIQIARITEDISLYENATSESLTILNDETFTIQRVRQENTDMFLNLFSAVPCYVWVNDPNPRIRGMAILITYANGSMEWLCADGTFYWNSVSSTASMTWFYFEKDAFANMLSACASLS